MYEIEGFSYFDMPRTGSNFVRAALEAADLGFVRMGRYHICPDEYNWDQPQAFRFTVIRNPFSWMRSWFSWQDIHKWNGMLGPTTELEKCRADAFDDFVGNYLRTIPGRLWEITKRYMSTCHYVGRTETAAADLTRALTLAGLSPNPALIYSVPAANTTHHKELKRHQLSPMNTRKFFEAEKAYFDFWASDRVMGDVVYGEAA